VWNASAWVAPNSQTANPPGLELIETKSTSGTPVNFFNSLSSTYRSYKIVLNTTATGTAVDISLKMTNGTTPLGGSAYSSTGYRINYASTTSLVGTNDLNTAQFFVGRLHSTGNFFTLDIELHNPTFAQVTTFTSVFIEDAFMGQKVGKLATSDIYDGFQLGTSSTWAGTVSLYGYRN
jgi:hypothetical protein